MKKILIVLVVVFFGLTSLPNAATLVDKIVATVDGKPITLYELKNIAGFYNAKKPQELLNRVIDDYLIKEYAENVGITISDDDVERYIENLAAQNNLSTEEFINKIKASGIDFDYYKEGVRLILYRIKFARKVFLPSIKITEQDIKNYYKLHKNELSSSNKIAVLSIITLDSLKKAQKVYKLLQKGKDFYKLLEKYSLTKDKTRDVPISALNPYLQSQILSLKSGEHTNIIESEGRFYIVKLIKIKEAEDIDQQIRNILIDKRINSKLKSWLKLVRARSDIEIYLK
ncbi:peptidyl-prolyl cis-trans isomerase [Hippea alviniae]|uniref:peptidyl-prolyl cis-trans isomerase n=1 Tax=Hippea alviniae TaxID=1279027 RepID=UPI0003B54C57|nr:peptidyl-prolyl cis-trans isomerase [Hippea alviniae]